MVSSQGCAVQYTVCSAVLQCVARALLLCSAVLYSVQCAVLHLPCYYSAKAVLCAVCSTVLCCAVQCTAPALSLHYRAVQCSIVQCAMLNSVQCSVLHLACLQNQTTQPHQIESRANSGKKRHLFEIYNTMKSTAF